MKIHKTEFNKLTLLTIVQRDVEKLFNRIVDRKDEYLLIFSLKRTRQHFEEIFRSYYPSLTVDHLLCCSPEFVHALEDFYLKVEDLKWYLLSTEDMPQRVSDVVTSKIKFLSEKYFAFKQHIDNEIEIQHCEKNASRESVQFPETPPEFVEHSLESQWEESETETEK